MEGKDVHPTVVCVYQGLNQCHIISINKLPHHPPPHPYKLENHTNKLQLLKILLIPKYINTFFSFLLGWGLMMELGFYIRHGQCNLPVLEEV